MQRISDLIFDAGDGKGNYWVNAGLIARNLGLTIPETAAKLEADGEVFRLDGDKCFVLMSEVRAERYRRDAERMIEVQRGG